MKEFKYKTTFSAKITLANKPQEDEIKEAKASYYNLNRVLPADIKPEEDPDLLYIFADLASPGLVNLNDTYLSPADAVNTYKKFEKKQCNIEHNRDLVCGYILKAYLTDRETKKIITEEEALTSGKPFNITTLAVLWKVVNRELCNFIEDSSMPGSPDFGKLSLSFEVGYEYYNIGITGEDRVGIGSIMITREDENFSNYEKILRENGGSGKLDGNIVFAALAGYIIPLGQGIVGSPAAQVNGVQAVTQQPIGPTNEEDDDDEDMEEDCSIEVAKLLTKKLQDHIVEQINSYKKPIKSVSANIQSINTMEINNFKKIEEAFAKVLKTEEMEQALANIRAIIADEVAKLSEEHVKQVETEKANVAKAQEEKEKLAKAQEELNKQLATLQKELEEIRNTQALAELETSFQNRMAAIDSEYELSEEERTFVVEEIRDLNDEEFTKWQSKAKILLKEKSKAYKASKKKELEESVAKAGLKGSFDEKTFSFREILAATTQVEPALPNTVQSTSSLLEEAKKAFSKENIGLEKK